MNLKQIKSHTNIKIKSPPKFLVKLIYYAIMYILTNGFLPMVAGDTIFIVVVFIPIVVLVSSEFDVVAGDGYIKNIIFSYFI